MGKAPTARRRAAPHEVDFVWDPQEEQWQPMFVELCAFKRETGHCRVSSRDKEHRKLWIWAATQRKVYNSGWLHTAR